MKLLKRFSLLFLALTIAGYGLVSSGPLPAKAQTRQMTFARVGTAIVLTDNGANAGTLPVTETLQDGTLKHTFTGGWTVVGSTGTFTVTFTGSRNTIMFLTGGSAINLYYADPYTASDYAGGAHDYTFRPYDIDCGLTETHAQVVSSLSGTSSPYSGHVTKSTRLKAPHDFACEFSVDIELNPTDTMTPYDFTDSYSTHVPGVVDLSTSVNPLAYTCTQSTSKHTVCAGWLGPDDIWQLNMYYHNATKPHAQTGNDIFSFSFNTGGDNSNMLYSWVGFTLQ